MNPEILVPLPASFSLATDVRGTVLGTSLQAVRDRKLEERYFQLLPNAHHDGIRNLVMQSWIPMDLAMAHYRVMNELIRDPAEVRAIGRTVSDRVQKSYVMTLVQGLKASGVVHPGRILQRMPSVYERMSRGGACAVWRLGPKDARVELHGMPLAVIPYYRLGVEGIFEGGLSLAARAVRVSNKALSETAVAFSISWV